MISETDRLNLLHQMASHTYAEARENITFVSARQLIEAELGPPKHEIDAYTREFLTNSFLIRRGDSYNFSHESIREYLVAGQFVEEIRTDMPRFLRRRTLQPAIIDFIMEMSPDTERLYAWIERTKTNPLGEMSILAGNAVTLLCSISKNALTRNDLSQSKLSFGNFSLADLGKTNFNNAVFHSCSFVGSRIYQSQIEKARSTKQCIFSLFFLDENGHGEIDWGNNELLLSLQRKYQTSQNSLGEQLFVIGDFLTDGSLAANMVVVEAADVAALHVLRDYCSTQMSSVVAIYWDELEKLFDRSPNVKAMFSRIAKDAASQSREILSPKDRTNIDKMRSY